MRRLKRQYKSAMGKPNTYKEFMDTLEQKSPSPDWPITLCALWWDAKGDWQTSHEIAQDIHSDIGNWIHAYLHRKEGDEWNAGYWYRKANRPFPDVSLEEELQELVVFML